MSERSERLFITADQAISAIAKRGDIHTFRSSPSVLIGTDWRRKTLVKALRDAGPEGIEIGGEACMRMGHGLVLHSGGPLFIEADSDILKKLEKDLTPTQ